jgi:hypothetical protein
MAGFSMWRSSHELLVRSTIWKRSPPFERRGTIQRNAGSSLSVAITIKGSRILLRVRAICVRDRRKRCAARCAPQMETVGRVECVLLCEGLACPFGRLPRIGRGVSASRSSQPCGGRRNVESFNMIPRCGVVPHAASASQQRRVRKMRNTYQKSNIMVLAPRCVPLRGEPRATGAAGCAGRRPYVASCSYSPPGPLGTVSVVPLSYRRLFSADHQFHYRLISERSG